jgi:hypothetical protein
LECTKKTFYFSCFRQGLTGGFGDSGSRSALFTELERRLISPMISISLFPKSD